MLNRRQFSFLNLSPETSTTTTRTLPPDDSPWESSATLCRFSSRELARHRRSACSRGVSVVGRSDGVLKSGKRVATAVERVISKEATAMGVKYSADAHKNLGIHSAAWSQAVEDFCWKRGQLIVLQVPVANGRLKSSATPRPSNRTLQPGKGGQGCKGSSGNAGQVAMVELPAHLKLPRVAVPLTSELTLM